MWSSLQCAARWCLWAQKDESGWRVPLVQLALVCVLILVVGDRVGVEAEEYSAYSDPEKPAISVILSEQQNVDEFRARFDLSERQVAEVLAATRRENRTLAREFDESERLLAANRDLPRKDAAKEIAASDYDEKVAAAVARTKKKIEAIVPGEQGANLEGWVDEQWDQEVRDASVADSAEGSTQIYTASGYYPHGIKCNVFATQYYGNTRREVALPDKRLKFGSRPRVHIRRTAGGPRVRPRVKEAGPWNIHDNYWARKRHRLKFKRVPRCKPEAQYAYYQNFNRGKDEFGREVLNPAGVDVTPAVARRMGLKKYQNAWVFVRFPWVHR